MKIKTIKVFLREYWLFPGVHVAILALLAIGIFAYRTWTLAEGFLALGALCLLVAFIVRIRSVSVAR